MKWIMQHQHKHDSTVTKKLASMDRFICKTTDWFPPYPRNLVPGGPSWRIRVTKLSPSFRGGGALGRWSLLIERASVCSSEEERAHTMFGLSADFLLAAQ